MIFFLPETMDSIRYLALLMCHVTDAVALVQVMILCAVHYAVGLSFAETAEVLRLCLQQ